MSKKHLLKKGLVAICAGIMTVAVFQPLSKNVYAADATRPEYFSLKDLGYVTSVKYQNPYGSCWGFSGIAAAETTILYQLGMTNEEYKQKYGHELDLSEKALAYYGRTVLTEESAPKSVFGSQAGEGITVKSSGDDDNRSVIYDAGGIPQVVAAAFSSGIGPKYEESAPYRGKNGIISYAYKDNDGKVYRKDGVTYLDTTGTDKTVLKDYPNSFPMCYSKEDDWTLPESERFKNMVLLLESNILKSPVVKKKKSGEISDEDIGSLLTGGMEFDHIDMDVIDAMKDELLKGKALTIAFCADSFRPDQEDAKAKYINTDTYAHYTCKLENMNHAVTIVGYDDNYSRNNFLDHSKDENGDGQSHLPEGDGAWIVKNSWGAVDNEFPNYNDWGVDGSGYFYLSYYDRSVETVESFTFDVSKLTSGTLDYNIRQYDMLQPAAYDEFGGDHDIRMANIFCTDENEILDRITFTTSVRDTDVEARIYCLNEGYKNPEDGKLISTVKRHLEDAGVHTLAFEEGGYMPKGTYYSIVITQSVTEDGKTKNIGTVGVALNKEVIDALGDLYYAFAPVVSYGNAVINPGESMVCVDGKWLDWSSDETEQVKETIDEYITKTIDYSKVQEDYSKGLISQEELAAIQNDETGDKTEKYMITLVGKCVDNFPIKTYAQKTTGNVEGFDFNLSKDGVLTISGSGDINKVTQKSMYEYGPWAELFIYANKLVIDPSITGLTDENGNVSKALSGFKGKVIWGDTEYELNYMAEKFTNGMPMICIILIVLGTAVVSCIAGAAAGRKTKK